METVAVSKAVPLAFFEMSIRTELLPVWFERMSMVTLLNKLVVTMKAVSMFGLADESAVTVMALNQNVELFDAFSAMNSLIFPLAEDPGEGCHSKTALFQPRKYGLGTCHQLKPGGIFIKANKMGSQTSSNSVKFPQG